MRDHTTSTRWAKALPSLLHDAPLTTLAWDAKAKQLVMQLRCLRRHVSGRTMRDTTVTLTLPNVSALAIAYDDGQLETRPSAYRRRRRIRARDLAKWPYAPFEIEVSTGHGNAALEAVSSGTIDWIGGDEHALNEARFVLCVEMQTPREHGMPRDRARIVVGSDAPFATSLTLAQWKAELDTWWAGWRKHWNVGRQKRTEPSVAKTTTSVYAVGRSRLPRALAAPVRAWFEAGVWQRDLGGAAEAQAIVRHWREGRRACVVVRGIEHLPAEDDMPAEDRACLWTLALRRRHARESWRVTTWSTVDE